MTVFRGFVIDAFAYFELERALGVVVTERGGAVVAFRDNGVGDNYFEYMSSFLAGFTCLINIFQPVSGRKQIKKAPTGVIRLLTLCYSDYFDCFSQIADTYYVYYIILSVALVNRFLCFIVELL